MQEMQGQVMQDCRAVLSTEISHRSETEVSSRLRQSRKTFRKRRHRQVKKEKKPPPCLGVCRSRVHYFTQAHHCLQVDQPGIIAPFLIRKEETESVSSYTS